jgi:RHS repeat-associated protein
VSHVASHGLHARRAGPKLASREKSPRQGEGVFVIRVQARIASREKALRYDGMASGGGTVNTYQWNARNQLTQISQNGNAQLAYSYDALGRRISKAASGGAPIQYLYDVNNIVQETQGAAMNPILVGLNIDERFARNDVIGRTYFLSDRLNSTIALTDPTGAIQQQYSYDPYGNVTVSNTTTGFTNPYQYTGREADSPGLYYYRARYYGPQLTGFISEDPIGFGGGQLSFYAAFRSDPIDYIDPLGLVWTYSFGLNATLIVPGAAISLNVGAGFTLDGMNSVGFDLAQANYSNDPDQSQGVFFNLGPQATVTNTAAPTTGITNTPYAEADMGAFIGLGGSAIPNDEGGVDWAGSYGGPKGVGAGAGSFKGRSATATFAGPSIGKELTWLRRHLLHTCY